MVQSLLEEKLADRGLQGFDPAALNHETWTLRE